LAATVALVPADDTQRVESANDARLLHNSQQLLVAERLDFGFCRSSALSLDCENEPISRVAIMQILDQFDLRGHSNGNLPFRFVAGKVKLRPRAKQPRRPVRLRCYISDFPVRPPFRLSTRGLTLSETSRVLARLRAMVPAIVNVWADNLAVEMDRICALAEKFNHVALDTEFPGVVVRPVGIPTATDIQYQTLRLNVDLLRIIQLGISLSNSDGEGPSEVACWQFNFEFSLEQDMYAQDSIDLLTSSGINFAEHERNGILPNDFAELLTSSGLVLNDEIKWISFHGGYDFGYLLKVLTAADLPESESEFFELLELFFPQKYDLKYLMRSSEKLFGGLNKLAQTYGCERIGTMHQAGSDSLLTLQVFFCMMRETFGGSIDDSLEGILHGLGVASSTAPSSHQEAIEPLAAS
jgi:CCR4-NOT transcription complex subunit 7/8